jgi:transcriptional regulator
VAQPQSESLYVPKAHRVEDRALLHDFMDENAFIELVTATPAIRITHIPVLLDRDTGDYGTLYGHVARTNPQSETFDGRNSAVVVFRGPHSYISPSWYARQEAVPTWNFAAVHATGILKRIDDKELLGDLLARLVDKFDGRYAEGKYDFRKLPASYTSPLLGAIVGFEMPVVGLEAKFKLGQERSAADRAGILEHLKTAKPERSLREMTASFYKRQDDPGR